ncbi:MAG: D-alanyl-D-alanine carboxypeptidase family protein [Ruminococcaceae bacterium]|nr:D-alanyl-D-alanine carboxypeptidase family protein [Oscillospiraceae bacterium]
MKALSVLGAVIIAAAIALVIVLAYRQTALPVETTLTTAKPTTAPTTVSTTAPTANPVTAPPDTKEDILLLVNYQYEIPDDYEPDLVDGEYYARVDKRAAKSLQQMLDDCRAAGYQPLICSSYRSLEEQARLYNNKVYQYLKSGSTQVDAEREAAQWVAAPRTSEHHTGLAVDIVDLGYQLLDEGQMETGTQQWLIKNCWKYGFILRYPLEKKKITHVHFEPWHYRYVGKEHAEKITKAGICLEEYLGKI